MLTEFLAIDWRAKALEKMEELCTLEVELGTAHERLKAHRVYSDRMRAALTEIVNLPVLASWKATPIARKALGME